MLILSGLALVGLRVQQVHLGYRLDGLRAERSRLDALVRQLEVEVATLRSPGRLEGRARQLGLVSPTREQVRLAREYVSAATGLAASEGGRVAVLELPPRPELRTRLPLQP
jgi:cell division protein FtsL